MINCVLHEHKFIGPEREATIGFPIGIFFQFLKIEYIPKTILKKCYYYHTII